MKQIIIVLITSLLSSCDLTTKKPESKPNSTNPQVDNYILHHNAKMLKHVTEYRDSLSKVIIDTSTLKGKQKFVMHSFLSNYPNSPIFDTLFDLNYDGFKDYVIGYYALAGTGLKNKIQVSFYDPKKENYVLNEQLSNLANPTFYINQKKITSFYLGNGGGGGCKLEWINDKWIATKEFDVDNGGDTTKWKINYLLQKKNTVITRQYQTIPPNDILETKIDF